MISMTDNLRLAQIGSRKKNFFFVPGGTMKNIFSEKKNFFFKEKNTWFCSEFNADSNHVIFFKKYWGRKNGLTATCPFFSFLIIDCFVYAISGKFDLIKFDRFI